MSRRTKQSEFSARVDKNAVAYALKSVKGAIVRVEPRIEFMARRNDIRFMPHIRVQGDGPTHLTSYDYDVSVTLLCTAKQAATIGIRRNANPVPTIPTPSEEHDENQATAVPVRQTPSRIFSSRLPNQSGAVFPRCVACLRGSSSPVEAYRRRRRKGVSRP